MKEKNVVISLHGIRTRGEWQKSLVPILAQHDWIPYVLDYGHFSAFRLMWEASLDQQVDWLVRQYDQIREETGCRRPSVIGHSFGSLQLCRMLEKYDHVLLDKVILAASIASRDLDWATLLETRRLMWLENNVGHADIWPRVASLFVPNAGASGTLGFTSRHPAVHQVHYPHHKHSDYFSLGHFRHNWMSTLTMSKRRIVDGMLGLLRNVALANGLSVEALRAFVFTRPSGANHLRVVPGLSMGSLARGENLITVSLEGDGAQPVGVAAAYLSGRTNYVEACESPLLRSRGAGSIMVHPELKWTVSLPLLRPAGTGQGGDGASDECCGVLVVDGLESPTLVMRKRLAQPIVMPDTVASLQLDIGRALFGLDRFEPEKGNVP